MKTTLAVTGALLASVAANAANLSLHGTIGPVGGDANHGSVTGSFNDTLSVLTFGATDTSPSATVTSITLAAPGGSILKTVTSIIAGANHSFSGIFSNVSAPGFNSSNAAQYIVSFYAGTTLVAKGGLSVGASIPSTPEPQTYAMVAGGALVGFAAFRRARR